MIKSIQETFASNSICFGCGPANDKGLRIRSMIDGEFYICDWNPEAQYDAFPGMLSGGIIGTLLDCHSNWSASIHLMKYNKLDEPPCTVTANYTIKLLRPTPSNIAVHLKAWIETSDHRKTTVKAELYSGEDLCATCEGLFVAVKEGHPAYNRWAN